MKTIDALIYIHLYFEKPTKDEYSASELIALLFIANGLHVAHLNKPLLDNPFILTQYGPYIDIPEGFEARKVWPTEEIIIEKQTEVVLRHSLTTYTSGEQRHNLVKTLVAQIRPMVMMQRVSLDEEIPFAVIKELYDQMLGT